MNSATLALFSMPGGTEWLIIGIIALLLFGRRLPDVARSFGKSIVEFKKGIRDVKDDLEAPTNGGTTDRTPRLPTPPAINQEAASNASTRTPANDR